MPERALCVNLELVCLWIEEFVLCKWPIGSLVPSRRELVSEICEYLRLQAEAARDGALGSESCPNED